MNPSRILLLVAALAVLPLAAGCSDDGPTQSSGQVLDRMWPNEDGRFWSYDLAQTTWGSDGPSTPSPVPIELPPLRELAELAAARETPAGGSPFGGTLRLEFDGMLTTGGVTGQNLVETFVAAAKADRLHSTEILSLTMRGGVWEKSADRIRGYGDDDGYLPWTYLEGELTTGHEFVQSLGPEGPTLRARVLGPSRIETPSGYYARAIEVFYVIDYGVRGGNDVYGNFVGYLHMLSYGSIHYAPGVGPVASSERMLSNLGPNGLERGYAELRCSLRSTGITP